VFLANLHAERGERNTFAIELFDPAGRKQKTTPDVLTYTIMIDVEKPPLVHSMGIALANNEYARFFAKGSGLPQQKNWPEPFRTVKPLKQGQSGDFLWIPIIEGENELADRNRLIKRVAIEAEHIRRDLPAGSEVDVTLKIDADHIVSLEAYVPLLDEEFKFKVDLGNRHTADADFLNKDFDNEMKRFREVKVKAAGASAGSAENLVDQVEQSPLLQDVKETLSAAQGDPDAAAKGEKLLLELKLKLDDAANALEWPALVKEAKGELADLNRVAEPNGSAEQKQKAEDLAEEIEDIIRERKPDRLRNRITQVTRLYFEIVMAQPAWWVYQFREMEKQEGKMRPQDRAARLLDQGRDCMTNNNATGLPNVVRQLWDLLPAAAAQAAKRGYEADLIQ
jgi:molecular chaperone DnaK